MGGWGFFLSGFFLGMVIMIFRGGGQIACDFLTRCADEAKNS